MTNPSCLTAVLLVLALASSSARATEPEPDTAQAPSAPSAEPAPDTTPPPAAPVPPESLRNQLASGLLFGGQFGLALGLSLQTADPDDPLGRVFMSVGVAEIVAAGFVREGPPLSRVTWLLVGSGFLMLMSGIGGLAGALVFDHPPRTAAIFTGVGAGLLGGGITLNLLFE